MVMGMGIIPYLDPNNRRNSYIPNNPCNNYTKNIIMYTKVYLVVL